MKKRLPISILLAALSLVGILVISMSLWKGGKEGTLVLQTIHGDFAVLEPIQVEVTSTREDRFLLTQTISFGQENQVTNCYTTQIQKRKEVSPFKLQMNLWTTALKNQYESLKQQKESGTNQNYHDFYYISPSMSYLFWEMYLGHEDASPFLKVRIPENAITKSLESNSSDQSIYPTFHQSCDSVIIDDRMYLTYYNWELNQSFTDSDQGSIPMDYEGVSGLFYIPLNEGVPVDEVRPLFHDKISTKYIPKLLEIEVSSNKDTVVLKMGAVFNDSKIALVVKEGENLVLYLYDIRKNAMLEPFVIGKWNTKKENKIANVALVSKDTMISLQIVYEPQEDEWKQDLYTIDYEQEPKVLFAGSIEEQIPNLGRELSRMELQDLMYLDGTVYHLMGIDSDMRNYAQYFFILVCSENSIDYLGKIQTDISEDFKFGVLDNLKMRNYGEVRIKESD